MIKNFFIYFLSLIHWYNQFSYLNTFKNNLSEKFFVCVNSNFDNTISEDWLNLYTKCSKLFCSKFSPLSKYIFNDFACTRHYSRCKRHRRHVGHLWHWHLSKLVNRSRGRPFCSQLPVGRSGCNSTWFSLLTLIPSQIAECLAGR